MYNVVRVYSSLSEKSRTVDRVEHEEAGTLPDSATESLEIECSASQVKPEMTLCGKTKQCWETFARKINMEKILAPATIAAVRIYNKYMLR